MREEYQKTIILLSIIFIFGGLYVSQQFDVGQVRQNNIFLFIILLACCLVAYLQTKRIKRWKEEKKTDYTLVYWTYFYFTLALIVYFFYMVISRSELECMRLLRINMKGAGSKMYYQGLNQISNIRNNGFSGSSGSSGYSESIDSGQNISNMTNHIGTGNKIKDTARFLFRGYKNIWKKMLFMK